MLGFEAPGGWRDVKGSVVMTVLQYLMGGGGSFSAGGPGKDPPLPLPHPHNYAYLHIMATCMAKPELLLAAALSL